MRTPNLDRLAAEGARLTDFYTPQPAGALAQAGLLSGCYPNRLGLGAVQTGTTGIHPGERLLSNLFQEAGYDTALFGVWQLGQHATYWPTNRGFNQFFGLDCQPSDRLSRLCLYDGEEVVEVDSDPGLWTRKITSRAVGFVEEPRQKPFFVVVSHLPVTVSEDGKERSRAQSHAETVREVDGAVGEILAALERAGVAGNTIVVFGSAGEAGASSRTEDPAAASVRERRPAPFEDSVRMPCLVRWPERVPAGKEARGIFTMMDWFSTLAGWSGVGLPDARIDGIDLGTFLVGEPGASGRGEFWYYSGEALRAVRAGRWKLHLEPDGFTAAGLFDLESDPDESRDGASDHPGVVAQLKEIAAAARGELGDGGSGVQGRGVREVGEVLPKLEPGVRRVADLEYSSPATGPLLLDLYLPEEMPATPCPVVLWIHGGGWRNGSKEEYCVLHWLAAEGIVVASLNYRLVHEALWPAQLDDCRAALRWVRAHAAQYGLDPERIAVGGGSAGGHLAALLGTLKAPESERVSAVIDFFGPTDLLTMPRNVPGPGVSQADLAGSIGARLLGGVVRDRPETARGASALAQVTPGAVSFLIFHGEKDRLVPVDQSRRLHEALVAAGVASKLVVLPGVGHGGWQFDTAEARRTMREFLHEYLVR